ncbi:class I SAM-dependent methyltransferase [Actinacidiphila sp. DG2A-62]|uniref:class I SAM-dependent methyltransferase n=1 Tax=Actinacidiphila sp. DG2A-62 TaxID=3108821 RepID=UPI002DBB0B4E|nr:class I SAM-dependent methyltransferase [Actinacidiphila sp. DG2A-62]MEC3998060.1 class I SAM-dependent methyltransferase [Actinacidiphila sp. DG2A-62]
MTPLRDTGRPDPSDPSDPSDPTGSVGLSGLSGLFDPSGLSDAFDRAAPRYDRLTAVNPGYRADLRRSARRLALPGRGAGLRLLDLGCGTGASTKALLAAAPDAEIVAMDASAGMLARAAAKRWPAGVTFVHAPVERLAEAAVTGPFDAVFAAYLFRNLADPDAGLATARDLLVPGGRLAVHEYTLSGRAAHRAVWRAVCAAVVEPAGALAGDRGLYRYLRRSVLEFDTAGAFAGRVAAAGFRDVRALPMPGWSTGIVHTFVGRAPSVRARTAAGATRTAAR